MRIESITLQLIKISLDSSSKVIRDWTNYVKGESGPFTPTVNNRCIWIV